VGRVLDDLSLRGYRVTLDSPDLVQLLTPQDSAYPYYIVQGWAAGEGVAADAVPGPDTVWSLAEGAPPPATETGAATEAGPAVATDAGQAVAAEEDAVAETVATLSPDAPRHADLGQRRRPRLHAGHLGGREIHVHGLRLRGELGRVAATLSPYAFIARDGREETPSNFILHEGVVRMSDGELQEIDYPDLPDLDAAEDGSRQEVIEVAENGWIGFTDKYWMTTLIPEPGTDFRSVARYLPAARPSRPWPARTLRPSRPAPR
jgi:YidC/Oxa1 family membrane protein insertase